MTLYFQHRRQVQPFSFAVIFLSFVITVLESLHLIICFLFFLKTGLLAFEAGSSSAQLQGLVHTVMPVRKAPRAVGVVIRTSDGWGPQGPDFEERA